MNNPKNSTLFIRRNLFRHFQKENESENIQNSGRPGQKAERKIGRTWSLASRDNEIHADREIWSAGGMKSMNEHVQKIKEMHEENPELKEDLPPIYRKAVETITS